jgi:hypothetical protein
MFGSSKVYSVFPALHRWGGDNVFRTTEFQVIKIIKPTHYSVMKLSWPTQNRVEIAPRGSYLCATQQTGPARGFPGGRIFMVGFHELMMTNQAAQKWAASAKDAKIVLRIAFVQAMLRPELTTDYADYTLKTKDLMVKFFRFRIGYATFMLMIMDDLDEFIVLDFDLQDEEITFADERPAAPPPPA